MPDDVIDPTWCVRELAAPAEIRATNGGDAGDDGSGLGTLHGHFSAVGEWYEIDSYFEGNFLERTVAGFPVITSRTQILFNHGFDPQVGDKVLAPIGRVDPDTTEYEGQLLDTSYNRDLVPGLRAGVYGSSFRFQVLEDAWDYDPGVSDYNPRGIPERTITSALVPEFGPVTFPANPMADSGCRSGTDRFYEQLLRNQPDRLEALAARAHSLRSPSGRPDARSAGGGKQGGESPSPRDAARNNRLRLIQKGIL
jgi:hypothetical protein